MFWCKGLLFILFFGGFQTSYTGLENNAPDTDRNYNAIETANQDRLNAVSDGLNLVWENTVLASLDSVFKPVYYTLKTNLKRLCGYKNKTALGYITSRNFIDLKFDTHKIAYHFHSFP